MAINPYRKGGADVPVADGGTGSSTASGGLANLDGLSPTDHDARDHTGIMGTEGKLIQQVFATPVTGSIVCTALLPRDNTIPQSSERTLVISSTITPVSTSNYLIFRFECTGIGTNTHQFTALLFDNASADAIAVRDASYVAPSSETSISLLHYANPTSFGSPVTYSIRIGASAGSFTLNNLWGGVASAVFTISEIAL